MFKKRNKLWVGEHRTARPPQRALRVYSLIYFRSIISTCRARLISCSVLLWVQMQVDPDHVVSVRLILRQPSSAWLTFSLEDVRIFPHMEPVSSLYSQLQSNTNTDHKLTEMLKL